MVIEIGISGNGVGVVRRLLARHRVFTVAMYENGDCADFRIHVEKKRLAEMMQVFYDAHIAVNVREEYPNEVNPLLV